MTRQDRLAARAKREQIPLPSELHKIRGAHDRGKITAAGRQYLAKETEQLAREATLHAQAAERAGSPDAKKLARKALRLRERAAERLSEAAGVK
ncbi:MAG: hypothetical protein AABM64_15105 [Pseudomonadota bacterium]